ncbi:unnamed protein product [Microthlaspi erraticum]|uniref:F-box domain-containing protein n=1 Tax=Microthlaspi erraticum TaxID=1685480 RepID=A0A6D2L7R2_9BRAS|nr:unnamed protein product [Microthlaspi erraticum]CAA7057219.1 unnamed protein product [Microthlaspi erraticum]
MNHQVEPPEKKKRKRKTKNSSPPPSPPSSYPSFSSLPDEIAVNCLARIPRSYYPTLSIVSKSFRSFLSSSELYAARSQLGSTEKCVYVCLLDYSDQPLLQWFRLWINPNRSLPNSMIKKKKKKKAIGQLLVPIPSSNLTDLSTVKPVAVGSELYVIGGPLNRAASSAVWVLDCRSHTWREAPSMSVARKNALNCVYDRKIYVFGGAEEEDDSWGEVFDTKTQTWERLPDPGNEVRKCRVWKIREMEGKIYYNLASTNYNMYAYDTKQCKWECECDEDLIAKVSKLPSSEYVRSSSFRHLGCSVYDVEDGRWKVVNGLESLEDKFKRNGGSSGHIAKVVRCGWKLFFIWEGVTRRNSYNRKKIWCAEIELQKCYGGELWGNVECIDHVLTVPTKCQILHCHSVSV